MRRATAAEAAAVQMRVAMRMLRQLAALSAPRHHLLRAVVPCAVALWALGVGWVDGVGAGGQSGSWERGRPMRAGGYGGSWGVGGQSGFPGVGGQSGSTEVQGGFPGVGG
ncbi:hypothetical protein BKM31_33415 [[Actinomadura] parvosata subsp. kistnae]|uniref:Uncharacterized protein n=1 Tax=[Actinomadura] parvosata subsp. kistnae TaxID=1909395 RepID=A0A1V0A6B1_9ACTN|nr:hypothetical protein BKM31_33415 [Nonomuraea sp. ATCC 55076]